MRYSIVAKATSNVILEKATVIERGDMRFEFIPDETLKLSVVAVSFQVPQDKITNFANSVTQPGQQEPVLFTIGGNQELREALITEFQSVEAHLSFATGGSLQSINWLNLENEEFIAESLEEKALLAIGGFSSKSEYEKPLVQISEKALSNLIMLMPSYTSLTIAKAFFREGMTFF